MYYLVYGPLYLLSLLPLWLLYGLSDGVAFLLFAVIRYRRSVVMSNLKIAFPEKTDAERLRIARRFYRNFTDNFIETIKLRSAGPAFLEKHFVLDNPELPNSYYKEGRKVQMHLGHCFNWEMANVAMARNTPYTFIVAYMPVANKAIERLFLHLRGRTGTVLLPATSLSRAILPYRHQPYMLVLVADQAPGGPENSYWMNFFSQPTPFVRGPERGARIADIPAVFTRIYKVRRGHYRAEFSMIAEHPAELPEGELTRRFRTMLEEAIRKQPDSWLWSHKRWKYSWRDDLGVYWTDGGKNKPTKYIP